MGHEKEEILVEVEQHEEGKSYAAPTPMHEEETSQVPELGYCVV